MLSLSDNRVAAMMIYTISLHVVWGLCALFDPVSYNSTALSSVYQVFGESTPYICFNVAILAFLGVFYFGRVKYYRIFLLIPQQLILMLSAGGAVKATILGAYADGVIRSHGFILADQAPAILAAVCQTLSIVYLSRNN
jgi:hypothetical protein